MQIHAQGPWTPSGAQFRAQDLGRAPHRGIAGRAGVVLGQRAIRRAEPQGEGQRLATLSDLSAGEDVEQLEVFQEVRGSVVVREGEIVEGVELRLLP